MPSKPSSVWLCSEKSILEFYQPANSVKTLSGWVRHSKDCKLWKVPRIHIAGGIGWRLLEGDLSLQVKDWGKPRSVEECANISWKGSTTDLCPRLSLKMLPLELSVLSKGTASCGTHCEIKQWFGGLPYQDWIEKWRMMVTRHITCPACFMKGEWNPCKLTSSVPLNIVDTVLSA